jgi:hypothetical protein
MADSNLDLPFLSPSQDRRSSTTRKSEDPLLRQHFKAAVFNYLVISLDAPQLMTSQATVPAGPCTLRATAPSHRRHGPPDSVPENSSPRMRAPPDKTQ